MEWILVVIIVACVGVWKIKKAPVKATEFQKINRDVPTQKKNVDDFAGNSVGAFFFMEAFADPATGNPKPESQHIFDDDYSDCDFIEEEFFD